MPANQPSCTNSTILLHQLGKLRRSSKHYPPTDTRFFYHRTFKLNVNYRRNCDFRIEDSERDLSAQFIDMDEQFFTPTMAKYQQQQQLQQQQGKQKQQQDTDDYFKPSTTTTAARPVSMFTQSTPRASLESKLVSIDACSQERSAESFIPNIGKCYEAISCR